MAGKLEYGGLILASLRIAILCGLAGCAAAVAPTWAAPRLRTVGFTRAVFRMDEGAVWGHVSGGVGCGIDYELLRWGQEGSEIRTERLGAAFSRAVSDIAGAQQDENLFEDARDAPDLQVAAAISDMRADVCEQPGLAGFRGSLSMTVQWQVYDPSAREIVGKFETHAAGQSSQNTANGVDDLFLAAFRANARDLMNEGVRVNTILPGVFKTPMVAMMPSNVQDALGAQVPFPKRLGQAEEYARLALFLIENVYMNAAAVRLDGGIRMAPR